MNRRFHALHGLISCAVLCLALPAAPAPAQTDDYERPPIDYLKAPVHDPVAKLQARLDKGEIRLEREGDCGYLGSVLNYLDVPVSSQVLVFSKTSFQRSRISPKTPRAIYFNDSVYVGYVKGGDVLEFSSVDPRQGAIFYTLEQYSGEPPRFERLTHDCLACHASSRTQDVPGHMVRSVFVDRRGNPVSASSSYTTDVTSPLEERWGGWYVTGTHGKARHMGNETVERPNHPEAIDRDRGANLASLADRVNLADYMAQSSDIVALLVLEHQTQMQNALAWASFEGRKAMHYQEGINAAFHEPPGTMYESTFKRLESAAARVVNHLLFVGEAPLSDPVAGSSTFATDFSNRGARDPQGRSLRDFDLKSRLFKHPCSYLIESEAFDNLPDPVLDRIARKLDAILSGQDQSKEYAHLAPADRAAIRDILKQTKPALAARWER
jgi:hypothetical protein